MTDSQLIPRTWHAIYTSSRQEKKVEKLLNEAGIETYCPVRTEVRQWSDRKKKVEVVLFTSYVFLKIRPIDFHIMNEIKGISRLVYYLGKPAIIADYEIEAIKLFLEQTTNYDIQFEKNQPVVIQEGPLAGKTGIIESIGKNKLRIRINQLGMSLIAQVHRNKVEGL
ncbi:MAG: UpxY family transcription antiterminator [Bacteroidales bacterium]|nr:UpxY family transcription antiterminator [Bacteroidales bacterium]